METRFSAADDAFMRRALALAGQAAAAGEVPVGAVLVRDGRILGEGENRVIRSTDPTAHAEVIALREAARAAGNYRLPGAVLYVTLEPCLMCAGALVHARLARLVFGAPDPKGGVAGTLFDAFALTHLNHRVAVEGGLRAGESRAALQAFFRARR